MKKILVALSLGLIASSLSLHATSAQHVINGNVHILQKELMNTGKFLEGKSKEASEEIMDTLQKVSKLLSKNMLEAVNDAKNARKEIDIESIAGKAIKSSTDIFQREYNNQEPFDGKKYKWGVMPTPQYAQYLAQPAIDAAKKIANILPYLKAKVPALLRQLADEAQVRVRETGVDMLEVAKEGVDNIF